MYVRKLVFDGHLIINLVGFAHWNNLLSTCFFHSIKTSIPQLFAVMRQWVPQTQRNIPSLTREVCVCVHEVHAWLCVCVCVCVCIGVGCHCVCVLVGACSYYTLLVLNNILAVLLCSDCSNICFIVLNSSLVWSPDFWRAASNFDSSDLRPVLCVRSSCMCVSVLCVWVGEWVWVWVWVNSR